MYHGIFQISDPLNLQLAHAFFILGCCAGGLAAYRMLVRAFTGSK